MARSDRNRPWLTIAIGALFLIALTMIPKLLTFDTAAHDLQRNVHDLDDKVPALRAFIVAERLGRPQPFQVKKMRWHGWTVSGHGCTVYVMPALDISEGIDQLAAVLPPRTPIRFVYRGKVLDRVPSLAVTLATVKDRLLAPFVRRRWARPLLVYVAAPAGCERYKAWPWAKLWRDG